MFSGDHDSLMAKLNRYPLHWLGPFIIVALIWEGIGHFTDPYLFPPLSHIISTLGTAFSEGDVIRHIMATLRKVFLSFIFGSAAGIFGGLIIGWFRIAEAFFAPLIRFTYSLPRVALIPLFIPLLGIGEQTIITTASIAVFYISLINTIAGVESTNPLLIRAAKNLGAGSSQMLLRIFLPASLGIIFSGIRLGIGQAFVTVVSGEIIIGRSGLGYWIWSARYSMNTALVFVVLIILGFMGYGLIRLAEKVEGRLSAWRIGNREELWEA